MSINWNWQLCSEGSMAFNGVAYGTIGAVRIACTAVELEDREGWVVVVATTTATRLSDGVLRVLWHGTVADRRGCPDVSAEQTKEIQAAVNRWTP